MNRSLLAALVAGLVAIAVAPADPALAQAGAAVSGTVDVPAGADGSVVHGRAPARFDLVGVSWRGPGDVRLSVRGLDGRWGAWKQAIVEDGDSPDRGAPEAARSAGRRLGNPWWVGPSNGIRYRIRGRVSDLRATFVHSPAVRLPFRRPAATVSPAIVPRSSWGADESIRRSDPDAASALRLAIVHHTAGANDYTREQAPAIVRAIMTYHVKSNGWNDIGYNFLVDRFGTVYEGRYGGLDQNVVGAHAQGFNTGSVGVAVLGTYEGEAISPAAEKALAELLAWRLDLAHVDPLSTLNYISNGNPRFPAGLPVFLRAVSGHRDTGYTSCPGDTLYARLGAIAERIQRTGLPKLYDPLVEGGVGAVVRVRARVSDSSGWAVRIFDDATQLQVALGTGIGPTVDWSWDATLVPPGRYTWRIEAPGVTAAAGRVEGAAAAATLAFTAAAADLDTISPNGDGLAESTTIAYTLAANANVKADVLEPATGVVVAPLELPRWRRAGEHTAAFDGLGLPDGVYAIRLTARASGSADVTTDVTIGVTRTLGSLSVTPEVFTPQRPDSPTSLAISFTLSQPAAVIVRVLREGRSVTVPFSGLLTEGPQLVDWNGSKPSGSIGDGDYEVIVEATDAIGTTRLQAPFTRDATPPRVTLVSRKPAVLAFDGPARVTGLANNARRAFEVRAAGKVRVPGIEEIRTLTLFVRDAAGNLTELRVKAPRGRPGTAG